MSPATSVSQRILDATEAVLRRHGPDKTNVVDIARALDMSHGNIYRHFPSKQALLEAVVVRWLNIIAAPLDVIARDRKRSASDRLTAWFETLRAAKRRKIRDDPEFFRMHFEIVDAARAVVDEHIESMLGQLEMIIADGVKAGEFPRKTNAKSAARAFLHATSPFHHPALLMQKSPPTDADAKVVIGLLVAGLRAGTVASGR